MLEMSRAFNNLDEAFLETGWLSRQLSRQRKICGTAVCNMKRNGVTF